MSLERIHPLGISDAIALSPEQREMISKLEEADLWFVAERLERKGALPVPEISDAILEFKRYLGLVGLGHRGLEMASPKVDEVWHAFLLFTREYAAFCQEIFGQFIHHVPRTSRTPSGRTTGAGFASNYERVYGAAPSIWLRPAISAADCGEGDCTGESRTNGLADCGEGDCTGEGRSVLAEASPVVSGSHA